MKRNIKDISLKLKLVILAVPTVLFLTFIIVNYIGIQRDLRENKAYLTENYIQKNNLLSNSQRVINSFIVFNHISFEKLNDFVGTQSLFFQTNDTIAQIIEQYDALIIKKDEKKILEDFSLEYQIFQNVIYQFFNEYKKDEINLKSVSRLFNKELYSYQNLIELLKKMKIENNKNFQISVNQISKEVRSNNIKLIIVFFIFIISFVVLSVVLFKDDILLQNRIAKYINKLSKGETIELEDEANNELVLSIAKISNNYEKITDYITSLKNKNYEFEIEKLGKNDHIFSSLQMLKEDLIADQKEHHKREKEDAQKEWANEGITKFTELMRIHSNDLNILADEIIRTLVKYLEASVGGIFIAKDVESATPSLELLSAFAYDRKKYYSKIIMFGEGLVGAVAVDRATIHLNGVPEDYLEIESGLGDTTPNNLLIIPLLTDNGLLGVIELASLRQLQPFEVEFAETVSRSIASSLETVKINARTIELLKESQKKSDELSQREHNLQEAMIEVNNAHKVAKRNEIEMTGILSGVDQTLMRAEYSVEGRLLNSNLVHRQTMGYEMESMRGRKIIEFVQADEKEEFQKMWGDVANGRPYQIPVKRQNKQTGADIWLLNQYTPIKDDRGQVVKILYLAIDITEQKIAEERSNELLKQSKEKESELQGVLNGIDVSTVRVDYSIDGNFLFSNDLYREKIGHSYDYLKNKTIFDLVPKDKVSEYKKAWQEVIKGSTKRMREYYTNNITKEDVWLLTEYNPIYNETAEIVKIMGLSIDITEQRATQAKVAALLDQTRKNELEMRGVFTGIDQTVMRAEYSADGSLLTANELHTQTLGYDLNEMKGKNILEFVDEEGREAFEKIWGRVQQGKLEQVTVKRLNKDTGDTIWLLNQYTPIENEIGEITKILYLAIDITEQKATEERAQRLLAAAKRNEIELSRVLSGVDKILFRMEIDPQGIVHGVNEDNIERLIGMTKEDAIGKNFLNQFDETKKQFYLSIIEQVKAGTLEQKTLKMNDKITGEELWVLSQFVPYRNQQGEVFRILYLGVDVTSQKIAEEKARELLSETQRKEVELARVLSGVDKILFRIEVSTDGTMLDANEEIKRLIGYSREQAIGQNFLDGVSTEESKTHYLQLIDNIKQGKLEQEVIVVKDRISNKDLWLYNQYVAFKNEEGEVDRILYLGVEITEQKLAEEKARELLIATQQKEVALARVLSGVDKILFRIEVSTDGTMLDANEEIERLIGYSREQAIGQNFLDAVSTEESKAHYLQLIDNIKQGKLEQEVIVVRDRISNKDLWIYNQYVAFKNEEGEVDRILYLGVEITEQKVAEEKARELLTATQQKEVELARVLSGVDRILFRLEISSDGTILDANEEIKRLIGYSREQAIGQNFKNAFDTEEKKAHYLQMLDNIKHGKLDQEVVAVKDKISNKDLWIYNQYVAFKNEEGEVDRILYLGVEITEQKIAEQKAQELLAETRKKELELRGVFLGVDRSIMRAIYSLDGTLLDANRILEKATGRPKSQLVGKNVLKYMPAEDKESFLKMIESVKAGHSEQMITKRANHWVLSQYSPIINEANEVERILYLGIDITEQKVAEEKAQNLLLETKQRELEQARLLSGIDEILYRVEIKADGTIVDTNKAHAKMLNYNKKEVVGKHFLDVMLFDDKQYYLGLLEELQNGEIQSSTIKIKDPRDGSDLWLFNQYIPFSDKNGKVDRILFLAINITEQKLAEEKAQELLTEAKIREKDRERIIEGIDQALIRAEYKIDGTLIDSNDKHQDIFDYNKEDYIGKNFVEEFVVQNKEYYRGFIEALKKNERIENTIKNISRKTGKPVWLHEQYIAFKNENNEIERVLYLADDVTKQKLAEEKAQELLIKTQKNELASVISGIDKILYRMEIGADGFITDANSDALKLLGVKDLGDAAISFFDVLGMDKKEHYLGTFEDIKLKKVEHETIKIKNKETQKDIWIYNQYLPIEDAEGNIERILYLGIDVTEQKLAEEKLQNHLQTALKKEREKARLISGIDGILYRIEIKPDGEIIDANETISNLFVIKQKDIIGKNFLDILPDQNKEHYLIFLEKMQKGNLEQATIKIVAPNTGKDLWLFNQYIPFKNKEGKVEKILYLAINVTEQKLAEEKATKLLSETQKKELALRDLLVGIDGTVMRAEYSVDGDFLSVNDMFLDKTGLKQEQIERGLNVFNIVEDKEGFRRLWKIVKSGQKQELTFRRNHLITNESLWTLSQFSPVFNSQKEVVKILHLMVDVTEQKLAEEKAQELLVKAQNNELEIKGLLSGVDRTIMRAEYSLDGVLLAANDKLSEKSGLKQINLIGKNMLELMQDAHRKKFEGILKSVSAGNTVQEITKMVNLATKKEYWILSQYTPVTDKDNKVVKALYLGIDVTEQKLAEEKVGKLLIDSQTQELKLQNILSSLDRNVMRARYKIDGTFIESNEMHKIIMGYKKGKMQGKNITDFIPTEEHEDFNKIWEEIKLGKTTENTVKRYNKTSNQVIWLKNQYTPIFDTNDNISEVLYLGIDITDHKKFETDLLAHQEKMKKELIEVTNKYKKAEDENKILKEQKSNQPIQNDLEDDTLHRKWLDSLK